MAGDGIATPYALEYSFAWNEQKSRWDAKATTYVEVDISDLSEPEQVAFLTSLEKAQTRLSHAGIGAETPQGEEVWLTFDIRISTRGAKPGITVRSHLPIRVPPPVSQDKPQNFTIHP